MNQFYNIAIKAMASTIYFTIALVGLLVLGNGYAQLMALACAFFAGASQLALQGGDDTAEKIGRACIVIAVLWFIVGWISFGYQIG